MLDNRHEVLVFGASNGHSYQLIRDGDCVRVLVDDENHIGNEKFANADVARMNLLSEYMKA